MMTDEQIRALMEAATAGPWKSDHLGTKTDLNRGIDLCFIRQSAECGDDPALARTHRSGRSTQEMVANARLIAAAPDLAAECLRRGERIAELEAQAIPTATLERWRGVLAEYAAHHLFDEIRVAIAQREAGNE